MACLMAPYYACQRNIVETNSFAAESNLVDLSNSAEDDKYPRKPNEKLQLAEPPLKRLSPVSSYQTRKTA